MKLLFLSCLGLLWALNSAKANEIKTTNYIESIVSVSKIQNKEKFIKKIKKSSQEKSICPFRLYSLGIEQWEHIPEDKQNEVINELAELALYL